MIMPCKQSNPDICTDLKSVIVEMQIQNWNLYVEKSTSLCLRDNKRGIELVGTSAKVRNPAKESYPYRALKTNGLVKEGHKT
jgi:hypothetical protein